MKTTVSIVMTVDLKPCIRSYEGTQTLHSLANNWQFVSNHLVPTSEPRLGGCHPAKKKK